MFFSAKELLTKSAKQIKYFLDKPDKKPLPTLQEYEGCKFQYEIAKNMKNLIGQELGGKVRIGDDVLCFSNDIVTQDEIYEVKNINGKYEEWFLKNSILQCAAYLALIKLCNGNLSTSKFFKEKGNKNIFYKCKNIQNYTLIFGKETYIINNVNENEFLKFFTDKINAIKDSYESCQLFDEEFKWKEFEKLKPYFNFIKVK